MKNVYFMGRQHAFSILCCLLIVTGTGINSFVSGRAESAGFVSLFLAGLLGGAEAIGFIRRTTSWRANYLVPGYAKKIWLASLAIFAAWLVYGLAISFALGNWTPPVGIVTMAALGFVVLQLYRNRTGSRAASISIWLGVCLFFAVISAEFIAYLTDRLDQLNDIWVTVSSPKFQLPAIALAVVTVPLLKTQIEMTARWDETVSVIRLDRFRLNVAGRFSFGGWPHPSPNFLSVLLYIVPLFVIVGVSHVSFADEDTELLGSSASWITLGTAILIYIGSGTPFALLKNPGAWLATAWQLGLGKSRYSVGRRFALGISKGCIGPGIAAGALALLHGWYIESPSEEWPGYANFYDEVLLLFCVSLLGFTLGCASLPRRTTEIPQFLPIRTAMCVASCFVFYPGIDFDLVGRVLLCLVLVCCVTLAINIGGRKVAEIDFLPPKRHVNPLSG